MKYKKWRELSVDFNKINYKNIEIIDIVNYPPAGNDVIECTAKINNQITNVFIKYERSKVANFKNEANNLNKMNSYLKEIPEVVEFGKYQDKEYIVLQKMYGSRLSEIFKRSLKYKNEYIFKYGEYLGKIHMIKDNFDIALQRPINDVPVGYKEYDDYSIEIINWLKNNNIEKNYNTFIHGDYHYANVLFKNKRISGVIDFEYSGMGFKEQDIAWACVLRPGQKFMDTETDINSFLEGYNKNNCFDYEKFIWCYINGSIHFYLMNANDKTYQNTLKKLINHYLKIYDNL